MGVYLGRKQRLSGFNMLVGEEFWRRRWRSADVSCERALDVAWVGWGGGVSLFNSALWVGPRSGSWMDSMSVSNESCVE